MPIAKKVRIYDLARELKQDTKHIIEELKRRGADVDVPSQSISVELAEQVRNKYFPKTETVPKRAIKIIKSARKEDTSAAEEKILPVTIEEPHEEITARREEIETPVLIEDDKSVSSQVKQLKKRIIVKPKVEKQPEISAVEEISATEDAAPERIFRMFPRKSTVDGSTIISPTAENKADIIKTEKQDEKKIIQSSLAVVENKDKKLFTEIPINSKKEIPNNTAINELKIDCRECLRPTRHNLIYSTNVADTELDEKYQIVQCNGCDSLSFRRITFRKNQSNNKEEIDLYPSRIKGRQKLQLESIPPTIAQIYEEIHLALSNRLLIVATTGMRTLIELVCNDLNSTAGNLKGKINDLLRRQLLTPKNANNLHKLRDFGNDAAHEANIQSENTLNRCIDIIEHLLKDIYSPEISS